MIASQGKVIDRVAVPAVDVSMEIVEGEVLLYHPQHPSAVYLNPTAAVVWGLCDGNRSVGAIIDIIRESYPDAGEGLPEEVLATLEQLQESGLLVIG